MNILLDVPYPGTKSRICFDGEQSSYWIEKNEVITITSKKEEMNIKDKIFYVKLFSYLFKGDIGNEVEVDDGKLRLVIEEKGKDYIKVKSLNSGSIGYMKSINLLGQVYLEEVSEEFRKNLEKIIKSVNPEKVIFSFLNNSEQIRDIKKYFKLTKKQIVPKIETPEAIANLESILDNCNSVMLGRGDLALTSKPSLLGIYQEKFLDICKRRKKEVIIATDIMTSNLGDNNSLPIRSDLIDLDVLIKNKVNYVVTSGKMGMGHRLDQFVDIIDEIMEGRY